MVVIDLGLRINNPRALVALCLVSLAFLSYTVLESGRALDVAIMELRYCAICWTR
ncbi:hypothetical protein LCGC14_2284510 [marine sediment metagenome]|uniref:Uncharacterized protein n=1 Tax=marine sediment metagenome TaxID=412755 RepID=A0A0F9CTI5_9ZZZZ